MKSKKYLEKRLASVQDSRLKRYVTVAKVRIMENGFEKFDFRENSSLKKSRKICFKLYMFAVKFGEKNVLANI